MTQTKTPTNEIISRADAKARGLIKYFTGKPCPQGHFSERHVSGGSCVQCKSEWGKSNSHYWKSRYWADPEADKARSKKYRKETGYEQKRYAENKEKLNAKSRAWSLANKERRSARAKARRDGSIVERRKAEKERRDMNPKTHLAYNAKRRAARALAVPKWFSEFDSFVAQEASELCVMREAATGIKWHLDHMIPLQAKTACGLHVGSNMQVIPAAINISKSNKMALTEYGEWLRHL